MKEVNKITIERNGETYILYKYDYRVTVTNSLGEVATIVLDLKGWSHTQPQRFGIIRDTLQDALKDVYEYFESIRAMERKFKEETRELGFD